MANIEKNRHPTGSLCFLSNFRQKTSACFPMHKRHKKTRFPIKTGNLVYSFMLYGSHSQNPHADNQSELAPLTSYLSFPILLVLSEGNPVGSGLTVC